MRLWGRLHLLTIVTALACVGLALFFLSKQNDPRPIERGIAIFLVAYYVVDFFIKRKTQGFAWVRLLPIEICSALFFIGAAALWTNDPLLWSITYLWTLSLTLFSLITPTPAAAFPSVEYFRYFFSHTLLIGLAAYVLLVRHLVPAWHEVGLSYAGLQAQLVIAGLANIAFNENFMFLRHKPNARSPFDYLGPWPVYFLAADAITFLVLLVWWGVALGINA